MHVAIIPPACQLARCLNRRYQMLLPDFAVLEPYNEYYSKFATEQYFTILDNGAFESTALKPLDLLELAKKYHVDEVIAPDTIGNALESLDQLAEFLSQCRYGLNVAMPRIMAVVQGTSLDQCKNYIDRVVRFPVVTTLGIPKHLVATADCRNIRTELVVYISDRYRHLWDLHYLGFVAPGEMMMGARLGVRSLDTSAPFICAAANLPISPVGAPCIIPKRQENYAHLGPEYLDSQLTDANIRRVDEWASYK